jgi:hypothetical protein
LRDGFGLVLRSGEDRLGLISLDDWVGLLAADRQQARLGGP